ncbi:pimeloyl-ACP methyl ester carboxylesterase [Lentzea flaviverrucosa]|uniref:Pimeloyl-ACP methyl ester carboxylesterase n=2 Tax=Lentzea flaviverrucosa TaxID=200379 RepID=A0A1H9XXI5_9PSEU|nr:pimeloyl-ACP methyl ester carboxylesterase [Lentzea flaviverrucosa]SES50851.1 Pimeloyl-ACP methyl ester carboxylesterase [Lentzea flaviverrucosa]
MLEEFVTLPDGRGIRAVTAGEGPGPLIVFEAGMSAPGSSWIHTQREVSARYRTLSYDRAGYGGSDADPHDRTLDRIADDLTALLDALGETEPVLLVGHSWGGPIIRVFADRHPERVAGMVFVDATLAEIMSTRNAKVAAGFFGLMAVLARLGAKGLIRRQAFRNGVSPEISAADVEVMTRDYTTVRAMKAGSREASQIASSLPVMRRVQDAGTPDVPTVCLQAGLVERGMAKWRPLFNRYTAELMDAVPRGRTIVVEGAGHLIPQENPAVVRETIFGVAEQLP